MTLEASWRIDEDDPLWRRRTIWLLLGVGALYALMMSRHWSSLHFDEAQYWTYGRDFDFGYYSKPPLAAWLIRVSTELFGDTELGVRAFAPLLHIWIGAMIYASANRLFDRRTGFWAAALYIFMPGVMVSSGLMTTDPVMMAAWSAALYALIRAVEDTPTPSAPATPRYGWWLLCGAALGLGLLAKYTAIAFAGGALGYALLSRPRGARLDLRGPLLMAVATLLVFSPNLIWNIQNSFVAFAHVADNAKLGGGPAFSLPKALDFLGAQFAVAGPVAFAALLIMLTRADWRREWRYRLLLWFAAPLPLAMTFQAFLSRAHPNWAAPAYIATAIAVAAWLLDHQRDRWLRVAIGVGVAAIIAFTALATIYSTGHRELLRKFDPYKKMRPNPPICRAAAAELGDRLLVSDDRRLLADCMFALDLPISRVRIWTPGAPGNHYQLVAPLAPGEARPILMLLLKSEAGATRYLNQFDEINAIKQSVERTHLDRAVEYLLAPVSGFKGYAEIRPDGS